MSIKQAFNTLLILAVIVFPFCTFVALCIGFILLRSA